jgi:hypothetical protein
VWVVWDSKKYTIKVNFTSTEEWIYVVCTYNGILFAYIKGRNSDICYHMDDLDAFVLYGVTKGQILLWLHLSEVPRVPKGLMVTQEKRVPVITYQRTGWVGSCLTVLGMLWEKTATHHPSVPPLAPAWCHHERHPASLTWREGSQEASPAGGSCPPDKRGDTREWGSHQPAWAQWS